MQLSARTLKYISKCPEGQPGRQCLYRLHHRPRKTDSCILLTWHTFLAGCLLVARLPGSWAQGLVAPSPGQVGASVNQLGALSALYASSRAAKLAYRAGARSACSTASSSLCASSSGSKGLTQLMVATSPVAYDSRNMAQVNRRGAIRGPSGQPR
jgi:hypothetical protein